MGKSLSPKLTFQQIQKYEHGKNRVSASTLAEIAEVLQAPIWEFVDTVPCDEEDGFSRDVKKLVRDYRNIGSEDARRVVALLCADLSKVFKR